MKRKRPKEIVLKLRPGNGEQVVTCPHCSLPIGRIINDEFHLIARHHGEKHDAFVKIIGRNIELEV
jgi:hypothetical protein